MHLTLYLRRANRLKSLNPGRATIVEGDVLWYSAVPLFAYIVLVIAAIALPSNPAPALYITGAVMFVLLFTGIHNAWDLVTYLAIDRAHPENERRNQDGS